MEKHLTYCDRFTTWLKKRLAKGIKTFTHRDILLITGTNCSYSVLQDLRLKFDFSESKVKKIEKMLNEKGKEISVTKQYKVYEVIAER